MNSRRSSETSEFRRHWAAKLTRRLEQVLNVHPEKYQNARSCSTRPPTTRNSPEDDLDIPRSHSADCGLAPIRDEDANGTLLMGGTTEEERELTEQGTAGTTERAERKSPQRGSLTETAIIVPTFYHHTQSPTITINVSGLRFETYESTLSRYPQTLLGNPDKRRRFYRPQSNEYFFDRHRTTFESILYIYQSNGKVRRPEAVPIDVFLREMRFFEMGNELLEEFWIAEGYEKPGETLMPKNETQRKLWELIEYPDSSVAARVIAFISIAVIIVSIVSFCWETIPSSAEHIPTPTPTNSSLLSSVEEKSTSTYSSPFFWVELVCIVWFTIELLTRFASCPSKLTFMASFLNIIDFVAIAPFFVNLILSDENKSNSSMSFAVLRVLRLVRVFRIFKLSRHSVGLQILGKTFRASVQEFILLIFFMGIALVLFASGMYFAEQGEPNSKFTSIPASFWFVLVTMTTVGYGDLVPYSPQGKIVGSMCALIGVLTLALPVPIIVANFKHFYRQENRLATMRILGKEDDYDES